MASINLLEANKKAETYFAVEFAKRNMEHQVAILKAGQTPHMSRENLDASLPPNPIAAGLQLFSNILRRLGES